MEEAQEETIETQEEEAEEVEEEQEEQPIDEKPKGLGHGINPVKLKAPDW